MANLKNKTGKNTATNKSATNKSATKNSPSNSSITTRKIPSFTSEIPDERERRDGPGGN